MLVAVPEVEDEYLTMNSVNYHKYLGFEECGPSKMWLQIQPLILILFDFKNTEPNDSYRRQINLKL